MHQSASELNSPLKMGNLIAVDEAVKEYGVSRNTLFRYLKARRLRRYKGGIGDPRTYIDRQELKRLLKPQAAKN
jgi:hypothetical protein